MKVLIYGGVVALVSGLFIKTVSGDVIPTEPYTYFADNFDNQTIPLGAPQVGNGYSTAGTTGSPFSLSTSPALGTQSLELQRNTNPPPPFPNPTLGAESLNGALVDGNTVVFSWDEYATYLYNAPIQIQIGYNPLSTGALNFVGVNDLPAGDFFYTNSSNTPVSTGVHPTVDGWDHVTVVMNLTEDDISNTEYMTGTMDFWVAQNGGPETELASDVALPYALIPAADISNGIDPSTSAVLQIQKGSSSGIDYYDNLSITGADAPTFVPEPVSLMGLVVCSIIGFSRRTVRR